MTLNAQLHVDPTTIRDPSLAPYIAASTIGKVTGGSDYGDDADEVLSTDTTEALREAAKKRADTYDEEDPQSNKTPVAPMGLLAMHLLNMKNFDQTASDEDFSDPDIRFKLLISISDLYKETGFKKGTHKHIREKDRVVNVLTGVAVDEVKHFSLTIPQQLSDTKNVLKVELYVSVVNDARSVEPRLIGMVEVHLHEIIQAMMVIDVLPLSLNGKQVANLYLEFAFMYGALGFLYSTQLENPGFNPNRDLSRTMFPRVALPEDRDGEVLMPVPQHPPAFIPWTCPVITHWDEAMQRAPEGPEPTAPAQFGDKVRTELRRILDDYVPLRSRGDRLAFLRKLVRGAPGPGQSADGAGEAGSRGDAGPPPGPADQRADRRRPGPDQRRTDRPGPDQDRSRPQTVRPDQTAQLRQSGGSTTTPMPALVSRTVSGRPSGVLSYPAPSTSSSLATTSSSSSSSVSSSSTAAQQQAAPSSRASPSPSDTEPPTRAPQRSGSSGAKITAPKQIRRVPLRRPTSDSSSSVAKAEDDGSPGSPGDTSVHVE